MTESNVTAARLQEMLDAEIPLDMSVVDAREIITLALEALALRTPSDGEVVDEAETWCRIAGKAMDALDALSNWEVESDDEDAAGVMADFAEKATAEIRATYPARRSALTTERK